MQRSNRMRVVTKDIDYTAKVLTQDALHYIQQTIADADAISMSIRWSFDEQQADPFHRGWTGDKFIKAVTHIVKTIGAGA